jgi:hypothetical protein
MSRLTVEPLPSPTTIPGSISRAASRAAASFSSSIAGEGVSNRAKNLARGDDAFRHCQLRLASP